ncbi:hypothetical protein GCM10027195_09840 [Comamonas sediminis]
MAMLQHPAALAKTTRPPQWPPTGMTTVTTTITITITAMVTTMRIRIPMPLQQRLQRMRIPIAAPLIWALPPPPARR